MHPTLSKLLFSSLFLFFSFAAAGQENVSLAVTLKGEASFAVSKSGLVIYLSPKGEIIGANTTEERQQAQTKDNKITGKTSTRLSYNIDDRVSQIGEERISYNLDNRVSYIGDTRVSYNLNNKVSQIGDTRISYTLNDKVSEVGSQRVSYDLAGKVREF